MIREWSEKGFIQMIQYAIHKNRMKNRDMQGE